MRRSTTIARFDKGLVSDAVVGNALLQADDVIPMPGNTGWRTRGGKVTLTAEASVNGESYAFPMPNGTNNQSGLFVNRRTTPGTTYTPCWWDGISTTYQAMEAQAFDNTGTALAFTGRANQFNTQIYGDYAYGRFDNQLWVLPNNGIGVRWAGVAPGQASVPSVAYTTGTVSTTAASSTITGAGTAWLTSTPIAVGMYIWINDATVSQRAYRIVSINSATSITVDRPLPAAVAAKNYRVTWCTWWSVKAGTFGASPASAAITPINTFSSINAGVATEHGGRVFVANTIDYQSNGRYNTSMPDRIRWCATANETEATLIPTTGSAEWGGAEYFHPNAYLDIDSGNGSDPTKNGILGLASFAGSLFVFKANAVYIVRGDVETDGRDVGASVDTILRGDGLVGISERAQPVVTPFGIVFAGFRGIYLVTPTGVTNLTDKASMSAFYKDFVATAIPGSGSAGCTLSWTGERVVLQNKANTGKPNTLVWYPQIDTWVTQTTSGTRAIIRGAVQLTTSCPNECAITGGQIVLWGSDADWTSYTRAQRNETPLMKLTSHPVSLQGAMNGRVRALLAKAKLVDDAAANPTLTVKALLGEQGFDTGVEAAIASSSTRAAVSAQTEKWSRHPVRVGTPPVDMVRFQVVQTGGALDCRFYQAGVEHVSVSRQR